MQKNYKSQFLWYDLLTFFLMTLSQDGIGAPISELMEILLSKSANATTSER